MIVQLVTSVLALVIFFIFTKIGPSEDICATLLKTSNRPSPENYAQCRARVKHGDISEQIFSACLSDDKDDTSASVAWRRFKTKFKMSYANASEELYRCFSFQDSLRQIELHNKRYEAGLESYFLKVTPSADMTDEEVRKKYLGGGATAREEIVHSLVTKLPNFTEKLPPSVDWSRLGYVTESVDQGACGSCWAFSTIGAVEGQYFKLYGELKRFSVQQMVDCTFNRSGCFGGWPDAAFDFIRVLGVTADEGYPYTAKYGTCKYNSNATITKIKRSYFLPPRDEKLMERVLATVGPISVGMYMPPQMRLYGGGVYNAKVCPANKQKVNHAVVLVGYGKTEKNEPYWLIKNSMGKDWGENGFFKLPRGVNYCSIAAITSFPEI